MVFSKKHCESVTNNSHSPAAAPRAEHPEPEIRQQPILELLPTSENESPPQSPPTVARTNSPTDQSNNAVYKSDILAPAHLTRISERLQKVIHEPSLLEPKKTPTNSVLRQTP